MRYPKLTTDIFLNKSIEKHGDNYDYSKVSYVNMTTKVIVICKACGKEFNCYPQNHLRGHGCQKCSLKKMQLAKIKNIKQFEQECKERHGGKYQYFQDYERVNRNIKIKCLKCNAIYAQKAANHLRGDQCAICRRVEQSVRQTKDVAQFEYECNQRHKYKYKYFGDYKIGVDKIKIVCEKHGTFEQQASSHLRGTGCPFCSESKGEIKIAECLDEFGVVYEREKKFDGCVRKQKLPFDFYLPTLNVCIEYDGMQHFSSAGFPHGVEKFERTKETDSIKNEFCQKNEMKLIRIPYFDFSKIKTIIDKLLKDNSVCDCKIQSELLN